MSQDSYSSTTNYPSDTEENIYGDTRFNAGGMFNYIEKEEDTDKTLIPTSFDSREITGEGLTPKILCNLGKNENIQITVKMDKIQKARDYIVKSLQEIKEYNQKVSQLEEKFTNFDTLSKEQQEILQEEKDQLKKNAKKSLYGITTGFGNFSNKQISDEDTIKLQENLIFSHACGTGNPLDITTTRMMMILRLNVLAKGHSGISVETVNSLTDAINKRCYPYIPLKGTVGASGDLAPLSHMIIGLMGQGEMYDHETKTYLPSLEVLKKNNCGVMKLQAKDGLALINGTQFMSSQGCDAIERAKNLVKNADVLAALTIAGTKGTNKAFDPRIHQARLHDGQQRSAENVLSMIPNDFGSTKVQDPYSLRCTAQVHGAVRDAVDFVDGILETEINSATDNPMIFVDENGEGEVISGGNFHGQYPAMALDILGQTIAELGSISERRNAYLISQPIDILPEFLVENGGLNNGFMITQYTAAALVSENKVLAHPASVDSIPTSNGKEDHVSMGGFAARKCREIIENVENILAIELITACQALSFHPETLLKSPKLLKLYQYVRESIPKLDQDRFMKPDMDVAYQMIRNGSLLQFV
jgi:histidine ammonia-lyase